MTTQHPEQRAIQDLVHVRHMVGWAKNGAVPADELVRQAQAKLQRLQETGVMGGAGETCAAALVHLAARRLPSEGFCTRAMREIDAVLVPLRNVVRSREGYDPLPAERVLSMYETATADRAPTARERQ